MVVGTLSVTLHVPESGSLKDKRRHLRSIKASLQNAGFSVAEVAHQDDGAVIGAELGQRGLDQPYPHARQRPSLGSRRGVWQGDHAIVVLQRRHVFARPHAVQAGPRDDRAHPAPEAAAAVTADRAPGLDAGVLERVHGVLAVPGDAVRQAEEHGLVALQEDPKGLPVTRATALDQFVFIHVTCSYDGNAA